MTYTSRSHGATLAFIWSYVYIHWQTLFEYILSFFFLCCGSQICDYAHWLAVSSCLPTGSGKLLGLLELPAKNNVLLQLRSVAGPPPMNVKTLKKKKDI